MRTVQGRSGTRVLLAGALAALITVSGCSTEDTTSDEPAAEDATALMPEAEGTTEYPLTLETAWGETELTERPERVAAISPTARDVELLALLGVTPVAAPSTVERAAWTTDALPGEIEEVYDADHTGVTPHELVAATDPDLIVVFGKSVADEFDQLSAIAPVVAAPTEEAATAADWRAEIAPIAEALDLSDAGEQVIDEYDQWFEEAREDHPEFAGLTATYLVQYDESGLSYFSTPGSDTEQVLLDLGFDPNPLAEQFADNDDVSSELISEVDADVLVVGDGTEDDARLEQLLTGTDLFQGLDAVRNDQYVMIDIIGGGTGYAYDGEEHEGNLPWALSAGGPLAMRWAAEQLLPMLSTALD